MHAWVGGEKAGGEAAVTVADDQRATGGLHFAEEGATAVPQKRTEAGPFHPTVGAGEAVEIGGGAVWVFGFAEQGWPPFCCGAHRWMFPRCRLAAARMSAGVSSTRSASARTVTAVMRSRARSRKA